MDGKQMVREVVWGLLRRVWFWLVALVPLGVAAAFVMLLADRLEDPWKTLLAVGFMFPVIVYLWWATGRHPRWNRKRPGDPALVEAGKFPRGHAAALSHGAAGISGRDWILVSRGNPADIRSAIVEYSNLRPPQKPKQFPVELAKLPSNECAVMFPEPLPPYEFLNLVNWLNLPPGFGGVSGGRGWFTGPGDAQRYYIYPDPTNPNGDTALGSTPGGKNVSIYLPEGSVCEISEKLQYVEESAFNLSRATDVEAFGVGLDVDVSFGNPGFTLTHPKDCEWATRENTALVLYGVDHFETGPEPGMPRLILRGYPEWEDVLIPDWAPRFTEITMAELQKTINDSRAKSDLGPHLMGHLEEVLQWASETGKSHFLYARERMGIEGDGTAGRPFVGDDGR